MKKFAGQPRTATETAVGTRMIAVEAGQRWWEGEGRGYTREFNLADDTRTCAACAETMSIRSFPTLMVPRADGERRGDTCRACRDAAALDRKMARVAVEVAEEVMDRILRDMAAAIIAEQAEAVAA